MNPWFLRATAVDCIGVTNYFLAWVEIYLVRVAFECFVISVHGLEKYFRISSANTWVYVSSVSKCSRSM